jgi:hypothetical protein
MKLAIHQFVNFASGINILAGYGPVIKLGIQGPAGTKFYLNNSELPVSIGVHQIYELDLSEIGGQISSLKFDPNTFQAENVIVDILYYEVNAI